MVWVGEVTAGSLLCLALIAIAAGALSLAQARIGSRFGTDNATHLFMIGQVRKAGGLFTRVPDLVNHAACGAFPIYLHVLLSKLPAQALRHAPFMLNPAANLVHVGLFAGIAIAFGSAAQLPSGFALVATVLFAFCPQFYHAFSARNFGFSSRGMGLLFLTTFFAALGATEIALVPAIYAWSAMVLAAYLIFAFNTFAAQSLVIIGALLVPIRLDAGHWLAIAGGLAVFVALHPRYSLSYLRDTVRFIAAYARDLAPVFILARRYSVWRDIVWDIPRGFREGPVAGLHYLYEHPLVVGIALNPLTIAVGLSVLFSQTSSALPAIQFATDISLAGLAAMLATSFRRTRFLGEPERYVEAVSPWIVFAGGAWLWSRWGISSLWVVATACVLASLGQLCLSEFLARRVTKGQVAVKAIGAAISAAMPANEVRLVANNEQITKLLLPNPWKFAYFLAVGQQYCGMNASQAFSLFPILRKSACERIARQYRMTVAVLQKAHYGTLFDQGAETGLRAMTPICEMDDFVVLRLEWDDAAIPAVDLKAR